MIFSVVGTFLNFLNLSPVMNYSTSIYSKFSFLASSVFLLVMFWDLGVFISDNLCILSFIDWQAFGLIELIKS